jgi:hypothetical protein
VSPRRSWTRRRRAWRSRAGVQLGEPLPPVSKSFLQSASDIIRLGVAEDLLDLVDSGEDAVSLAHGVFAGQWSREFSRLHLGLRTGSENIRAACDALLRCVRDATRGLGGPGLARSSSRSCLPLVTAHCAEEIRAHGEALVTVRNLEAGVRRTDGREQRFEAFKAPALAPLSEAPVRNFAVDQVMFEGLAESDFRAAFVCWARFTAPDGTRWEIGYDGAAEDYLEPRGPSPTSRSSCLSPLTGSP